MIDNDFCINHVNSDYAESTCFTNLIFFFFTINFGLLMNNHLSYKNYSTVPM